MDDLQLNRIVLGRMLQKLGFEVIEAENGLAAIDQFLSHRSTLCCVLLDLQMPVLNGWETAKRLRGIEADSSWSRTPIVACTALGPHEHWHEHDTVAESALDCGFDDLLVSPDWSRSTVLLMHFASSYYTCGRLCGSMRYELLPELGSKARWL